MTSPDERRLAWLNAGQHLLKNQGQGGLTIAALCQATGASKGSFYHHFTDRQSFLAALGQHCAGQGENVDLAQDPIPGKKQPWFDSALQLLQQQGYVAVTIDNLVQQLGVSKGAFYYLFGSRGQFVSELLDTWEAQTTGHILQVASQAQSQGEIIETILKLSRQLTGRRSVEVNIRAWALSDETVRSYLARVDAQRLAACRAIIAQILPGDDTRIETLATIAYASYVGSQQLQPPVSEEQWSTMLKRLAELMGIPAL